MFVFGQKMKRVEKTVPNMMLKKWESELKGEGLVRTKQEIRRRKRKQKR